MDTTARNLIHGLIGDSGAELIIDDDGSVYIDVSCAKDGIVPLAAEDIHALMLDLAVALRITGME